MSEGTYKRDLAKRIKNLFKDCVILKNDASYMPGVPDMLILFHDKWAMLEVKNSSRAAHEPNQPYWISVLDHMSFARTIHPENEEEVLYDLQLAFKSHRPTRFSRR